LTPNINPKTIDKNVPLQSKRIVHNADLVHNYQHYPQRRRYIKKEQIKEIAVNKYEVNGLGITFEDITINLRVSKEKAQRILKHHCEENFLFTAQDLEKKGIKLKGFQRENPQRYYLTEMKSKIIEDNKKNVQIDTTGSNLIETQKIQYLQDLFCKISTYMLYIHKLQIETKVDKKCYDELKDVKAEPVNKFKIYEQRIGQVHGPPNVKYIVSPKGTIMIYIACSDNPFRLYDEHDISNIMIFLGRVEDRLRYIFSDTIDHIIPKVEKWILKGCDVNKDIEIDSFTQITLQDIQMPSFENALRAYVKVIGNKAYYRFEKSVTPNKPVAEAFEDLRKDIDLEKDFQNHGYEDDGSR
jgi:hypothetical protein